MAWLVAEPEGLLTRWPAGLTQGPLVCGTKTMRAVATLYRNQSARGAPLQAPGTAPHLQPERRGWKE